MKPWQIYKLTALGWAPIGMRYASYASAFHAFLVEGYSSDQYCIANA